MVKKQIHGRRGSGAASGLRAELNLLNPNFRQAVHLAVKAYNKAGVPYAVIGGLAAGAYSEPRTTKDVDFLVGDEAFDSVGLVISFKAGIPQQAAGVAVDSVPIDEELRDLYEQALESAVDSDEPGVRIVTPVYLVMLKLHAMRGKDRQDVVAVLKSGAVDVDDVSELISGNKKLEDALARVLRELAEENDE